MGGKEIADLALGKGRKHREPSHTSHQIFAKDLRQSTGKIVRQRKALCQALCEALSRATDTNIVRAFTPKKNRDRQFSSPVVKDTEVHSGLERVGVKIPFSQTPSLLELLELYPVQPPTGPADDGHMYYSIHGLTQALLYLREELRACDDPNSVRKGKVPRELHARLLALIKQADEEATTVRDDGVTKGSTKMKLFRKQHTPPGPSEEEIDDRFPLGSRCYLRNKEIWGTVRFVGETIFAPGIWVGVELEGPFGKNDGSVSGLEYFKCRPKHGLFVRQHALLTDAEKEAEDLMEEDEQNYRIADRQRQQRLKGSRALPGAVLSTSDMLELEGIMPPEDNIALPTRGRHGDSPELPELTDGDSLPEADNRIRERGRRQSPRNASGRLTPTRRRRWTSRSPQSQALDLIDESAIESDHYDIGDRADRGPHGASGHVHISPGGDITIDMPSQDSTAHTLHLNDASASFNQSTHAKAERDEGNEVLQKITKCISEDPRKAVGVFEQVDSDDDGLLDQGEAARAFRRMGVQLRLAELSTLFTLPSVTFKGKLMYSSLLALQAVEEADEDEDESSADSVPATVDDDGVSVVVPENGGIVETDQRHSPAQSGKSPLARFVGSNRPTPYSSPGPLQTSALQGPSSNGVAAVGSWSVSQPQAQSSPPKTVHIDPNGSINITTGPPPRVAGTMGPPPRQPVIGGPNPNSSVLFGQRSLTPAEATARPGDTRRATGMSLQQSMRRSQFPGRRLPMSTPAQFMGPSGARNSARQLPRRRTLGRPIPGGDQTHRQAHSQQEPHSTATPGRSLSTPARSGYFPGTSNGEPSVAAVGAQLADTMDGRRTVQPVSAAPGQWSSRQGPLSTISAPPGRRSFRFPRRAATKFEKETAARRLQILMLRVMLKQTRDTYSQRYEELSEKFGFLADQSDALNRRMADATADNQALKQENEDLVNQNTVLKKDLASLEDKAIVKERRVLVRRLTAAENEVKELTLTLSKQQVQYREQMDELLRLQAENRHLASSVDKQKAQDKTMENDTKVLTERLASFEKKIYALQGRIGELTQERDDAVSKSYRSNQNAEKLRVQLQELQHALNARLDAKTGLIERLQDISDHSHAQSDLAEEVRRQFADLQDMEAENKRLTQTLEEVRQREEQNAAATAAVGKEAARLRTQAADLENRQLRSGTGRLALRGLQMMVQKLKDQVTGDLRSQVVDMAKDFGQEVAEMQTLVSRAVSRGLQSGKGISQIRQLYAHEWLARREQNRRLVKLWGPLRVVCWVPDHPTSRPFGDAVNFVADEHDSAVRVVHGDGRQQQFSYHRVLGPNTSQVDAWGEYEDTLQMAMMGQKGCIFHMFPVSSMLVEGQSRGQTQQLLEHLTSINEHVWQRLFALQEGHDSAGGDKKSTNGNTDSSIQYKFSVSYTLVHCGQVFDLLTNSGSARINDQDVGVQDFSCVEVRQLEEALQLTALGSRKRIELAATNGWAVHKTHAVMSISIDCLNFITGQQYAGCVKVVQLAGLDSQKQQQQQKRGTLNVVSTRETVFVNRSLVALTEALAGLHAYPPLLKFSAESKLGLLVADCLGEGTFSTALVQASNEIAADVDAMSSLRFAIRMRPIAPAVQSQLQMSRSDEPGRLPVQSIAPPVRSVRGGNSVLRGTMQKYMASRR